jgi:hypothetical protein
MVTLEELTAQLKKQRSACSDEIDGANEQIRLMNESVEMSPDKVKIERIIKNKIKSTVITGQYPRYGIVSIDLGGNKYRQVSTALQAEINSLLVNSRKGVQEPIFVDCLHDMLSDLQGDVTLHGHDYKSRFEKVVEKLNDFPDVFERERLGRVTGKAERYIDLIAESESTLAFNLTETHRQIKEAFADSLTELGLGEDFAIDKIDILIKNLNTAKARYSKGETADEDKLRDTTACIEAMELVLSASDKIKHFEVDSSDIQSNASILNDVLTDAMRSVSELSNKVEQINEIKADNIEQDYNAGVVECRAEIARLQTELTSISDEEISVLSSEEVLSIQQERKNLLDILEQQLDAMTSYEYSATDAIGKIESWTKSLQQVSDRSNKLSSDKDKQLYRTYINENEADIALTYKLLGLNYKNLGMLKKEVRDSLHLNFTSSFNKDSVSVLRDIKVFTKAKNAARPKRMHHDEGSGGTDIESLSDVSTVSDISSVGSVVESELERDDASGSTDLESIESISEPHTLDSLNHDLESVERSAAEVLDIAKIGAKRLIDEIRSNIEQKNTEYDELVEVLGKFGVDVPPGSDIEQIKYTQDDVDRIESLNDLAPILQKLSHTAKSLHADYMVVQDPHGSENVYGSYSTALSSLRAKLTMKIAHLSYIDANDTIKIPNSAENVAYNEDVAKLQESITNLESINSANMSEIIKRIGVISRECERLDGGRERIQEQQQQTNVAVLDKGQAKIKILVNEQLGNLEKLETIIYPGEFSDDREKVNGIIKKHKRSIQDLQSEINRLGFGSPDLIGRIAKIEADLLENSDKVNKFVAEMDIAKKYMQQHSELSIDVAEYKKQDALDTSYEVISRIPLVRSEVVNIDLGVSLERVHTAKTEVSRAVSLPGNLWNEKLPSTIDYMELEDESTQNPFTEMDYATKEDVVIQNLSDWCDKYADSSGSSVYEANTQYVNRVHNLLGFIDNNVYGTIEIGNLSKASDYSAYEVAFHNKFEAVSKLQDEIRKHQFVIDNMQKQVGVLQEHIDKLAANSDSKSILILGILKLQKGMLEKSLAQHQHIDFSSNFIDFAKKNSYLSVSFEQQQTILDTIGFDADIRHISEDNLQAFKKATEQLIDDAGLEDKLTNLQKKLDSSRDKHLHASMEEELLVRVQVEIAELQDEFNLYGVNIGSFDYLARLDNLNKAIDRVNDSEECHLVPDLLKKDHSSHEISGLTNDFIHSSVNNKNDNDPISEDIAPLLDGSILECSDRAVELLQHELKNPKLSKYVNKWCEYPQKVLAQCDDNNHNIIDETKAIADLLIVLSTDSCSKLKEAIVTDGIDLDAVQIELGQCLSDYESIQSVQRTMSIDSELVGKQLVALGKIESITNKVEDVIRDVIIPEAIASIIKNESFASVHQALKQIEGAYDVLSRYPHLDSESILSDAFREYDRDRDFQRNEYLGMAFRKVLSKDIGVKGKLKKLSLAINSKNSRYQEHAENIVSLLERIKSAENFTELATLEIDVTRIIEDLKGNEEHGNNDLYVYLKKLNSELGDCAAVTSLLEDKVAERNIHISSLIEEEALGLRDLIDEFERTTDPNKLEVLQSDLNNKLRSLDTLKYSEKPGERECDIFYRILENISDKYNSFASAQEYIGDKVEQVYITHRQEQINTEVIKQIMAITSAFNGSDVFDINGIASLSVALDNSVFLPIESLGKQSDYEELYIEAFKAALSSHADFIEPRADIQSLEALNTYVLDIIQINNNKKVGIDILRRLEQHISSMPTVNEEEPDYEKTLAKQVQYLDDYKELKKELEQIQDVDISILYKEVCPEPDNSTYLSRCDDFTATMHGNIKKLENKITGSDLKNKIQDLFIELMKVRETQGKHLYLDNIDSHFSMHREIIFGLADSIKDAKEELGEEQYLQLLDEVSEYSGGYMSEFPDMYQGFIDEIESSVDDFELNVSSYINEVEKEKLTELFYIELREKLTSSRAIPDNSARLRYLFLDAENDLTDTIFNAYQKRLDGFGRPDYLGDKLIHAVSSVVMNEHNVENGFSAMAEIYNNLKAQGRYTKVEGDLGTGSEQYKQISSFIALMHKESHQLEVKSSSPENDKDVLYARLNELRLHFKLLKEPDFDYSYYEASNILDIVTNDLNSIASKVRSIKADLDRLDFPHDIVEISSLTDKLDVEIGELTKIKSLYAHILNNESLKNDEYIIKLQEEIDMIDKPITSMNSRLDGMTIPIASIDEICKAYKSGPAEDAIIAMHDFLIAQGLMNVRSHNFKRVFALLSESSIKYSPEHPQELGNDLNIMADFARCVMLDTYEIDDEMYKLPGGQINSGQLVYDSDREDPVIVGCSSSIEMFNNEHAETHDIEVRKILEDWYIREVENTTTSSLSDALKTHVYAAGYTIDFADELLEKSASYDVDTVRDWYLFKSYIENSEHMQELARRMINDDSVDVTSLSIEQFDKLSKSLPKALELLKKAYCVNKMEFPSDFNELMRKTSSFPFDESKEYADLNSKLDRWEQKISVHIKIKHDAAKIYREKDIRSSCQIENIAKVHGLDNKRRIEEKEKRDRFEQVVGEVHEHNRYVRIVNDRLTEKSGIVTQLQRHEGDVLIDGRREAEDTPEDLSAISSYNTELQRVNEQIKETKDQTQNVSSETALFKKGATTAGEITDVRVKRDKVQTLYNNIAGKINNVVADIDITSLTEEYSSLLKEINRLKEIQRRTGKTDSEIQQFFGEVGLDEQTLHETHDKFMKMQKQQNEIARLKEELSAIKIPPSNSYKIKAKKQARDDVDKFIELVASATVDADKILKYLDEMKLPTNYIEDDVAYLYIKEFVGNLQGYEDSTFANANSLIEQNIVNLINAKFVKLFDSSLASPEAHFVASGVSVSSSLDDSAIGSVSSASPVPEAEKVNLKVDRVISQLFSHPTHEPAGLVKGLVEFISNSLNDYTDITVESFVRWSDSSNHHVDIDKPNLVLFGKMLESVALDNDEELNYYTQLYQICFIDVPAEIDAVITSLLENSDDPYSDLIDLFGGVGIDAEEIMKKFVEAVSNDEVYDNTQNLILFQQNLEDAVRARLPTPEPVPEDGNAIMNSVVAELFDRDIDTPASQRVIELVESLNIRFDKHEFDAGLVINRIIGQHVDILDHVDQNTPEMALFRKILLNAEHNDDYAEEYNAALRRSMDEYIQIYKVCFIEKPTNINTAIASILSCDNPASRIMSLVDIFGGYGDSADEIMDKFTNNVTGVSLDCDTPESLLFRKMLENAVDANKNVFVEKNEGKQKLAEYIKIYNICFVESNTTIAEYDDEIESIQEMSEQLQRRMDQLDRGRGIVGMAHKVVLPVEYEHELSDMKSQWLAKLEGAVSAQAENRRNYSSSVTTKHEDNIRELEEIKREIALKKAQLLNLTTKMSKTSQELTSITNDLRLKEIEYYALEKEVILYREGAEKAKLISSSMSEVVLGFTGIRDEVVMDMENIADRVSSNKDALEERYYLDFDLSYGYDDLPEFEYIDGSATRVIDFDYIEFELAVDGIINATDVAEIKEHKEVIDAFIKAAREGPHSKPFAYENIHNIKFLNSIENLGIGTPENFTQASTSLSTYVTKKISAIEEKQKVQREKLLADIHNVRINQAGKFSAKLLEKVNSMVDTENKEKLESLNKEACELLEGIHYLDLGHEVIDTIKKSEGDSVLKSAVLSSGIITGNGLYLEVNKIYQSSLAQYALAERLGKEIISLLGRVPAATLVETSNHIPHKIDAILNRKTINLI